MLPCRCAIPRPPPAPTGGRDGGGGAQGQAGAACGEANARSLARCCWGLSNGEGVRASLASPGRPSPLMAPRTRPRPILRSSLGNERPRRRSSAMRRPTRSGGSRSTGTRWRGVGGVVRRAEGGRVGLESPTLRAGASMPAPLHPRTPLPRPRRQLREREGREAARQKERRDAAARIYDRLRLEAEAAQRAKVRRPRRRKAGLARAQLYGPSSHQARSCRALAELTSP
jgi:hypothetical protein